MRPGRYKSGRAADGRPVRALMLPLQVQTPSVATLTWEQRNSTLCKYFKALCWVPLGDNYSKPFLTLLQPKV
jgi:hypothetical protein